MTPDAARIETAKWYAAQTDSRLRGIREGAWMANDPDRYSYAAAEILRRTLGGDFWSHFRLGWYPLPRGLE
jgi:hypothetical protein